VRRALAAALLEFLEDEELKVLKREFLSLLERAEFDLRPTGCTPARNPSEAGRRAAT